MLPFGNDKLQMLRIVLGTSVAPTHHCQRDSRQGGKGMLPLRFFQQINREAMQPREEKTIVLTAADWVRMCRATYSRGFGAPNDMPQNERKRMVSSPKNWSGWRVARTLA